MKRVFLDFSVAGDPVGRVIFELFVDDAPKTCENFRALCTGEKGLSSTGIPLYYKNSVLHRCIADFMLQGGDFTKLNGQGGESIYGPTPFEDENLSRPVDTEGLLCSANKGPNTNGSQFFITLRSCPHLDGKHTVFGKVVRGYDVVLKLADVPVDEKSRPLSTILVSNCGELELRKVAKPAKPASPASSDAEEPRRRRKSKRSASADSDRSGGRRKKSKKKKREEPPTEPTAPPQETEEEYDARLEREEVERIEAQRKLDLRRAKERYEKEAQNNNGGVRLKGRGRMVYVDPESTTRRYS